MSDLTSTAEQVARVAGARPQWLLGALLGGALLALASLSLIAWWADRRARRAWARAEALWRALARIPWVVRLERRAPRVFGVFRELSTPEYLLLHLALGFTACATAGVFALVAFGVARAEAVTRVDVALAHALRTSQTDAGVAALRAFTRLGDGWTVTSLAVVVTLGLWVRGRRTHALGWAIALAGVGALNRWLKALFARPRPSFDPPAVEATGFSFPSGHAMGTMVAVGMLAYLGIRLARTTARRAALVALALSWAVTMGYSRLYLGVHYLSDVVAGWIGGVGWLAVCISGLEIATRRPPRPPPEAAA